MGMMLDEVISIADSSWCRGEGLRRPMTMDRH